MPAYLLALCEVTNPTEEFQRYVELSAQKIHEHGGKYVVRGPAADIFKSDSGSLEGKAVIISEFPSIDALNGFMNDPEYKNDIAPLREGSGIYDFASYEGAAPDLQ